MQKIGVENVKQFIFVIQFVKKNHGIFIKNIVEEINLYYVHLVDLKILK
jgi:hypothetical protein